MLDDENKRTGGGVERYIYLRYAERQGAVTQAETLLQEASSATFGVGQFLRLFEGQHGIRRSVDKVYEVVAFSLFETIVDALAAEVRVTIPPASKPILRDFEDLTRVLLGVSTAVPEWKQQARLYRVGVTNAADRGLDMWAIFGPAVQVKHITLNPAIAQTVVDQIESDHIVVVCKAAEAGVIETVTGQLGWGRRVRGIVTESDLERWYDCALRGTSSAQTAEHLLDTLRRSFMSEFPQTVSTAEFLVERGYASMPAPAGWETDTEVE